MIELGNHNVLKVLRSTSVGLFLGDGEGTEILLPNKYVPRDYEVGQAMRVFCYLDNSERPVATTLDPLVKRNEFAYLRVAEVGPFGAFMDWGLEKHLLVPFREQPRRMEAGKHYIVHCYLDTQTMRLTGSGRVDRFLTREVSDYQANAAVGLLVHRKTPLGWEAIVDNLHKGLLFDNEIFQELAVGDRPTGYIKKVREDGKLDLSLQPIGARMLEPTAERIFDRLREAGGFLPLHDKSSPEEIQQGLQLSKKAFKKGVGVLYRERRITIGEDGIRLV